MDESAHCPYRVRIYMYMARCSVKRNWYATEISRSMRAARCLLVFFFIFIFFLLHGYISGQSVAL